MSYTLKQAIMDYLNQQGDSKNHEFRCGVKLVSVRLSVFLINWYNQSIEEWELFGTQNHANAIKKLIEFEKLQEKHNQKVKHLNQLYHGKTA